MTISLKTCSLDTMPWRNISRLPPPKCKTNLKRTIRCLSSCPTTKLFMRAYTSFISWINLSIPRLKLLPPSWIMGVIFRRKKMPTGNNFFKNQNSLQSTKPTSYYQNRRKVFLNMQFYHFLTSYSSWGSICPKSVLYPFKKCSPLSAWIFRWWLLYSYNSFNTSCSLPKSINRKFINPCFSANSPKSQLWNFPSTKTTPKYNTCKQLKIYSSPSKVKRQK